MSPNPTNSVSNGLYIIIVVLSVILGYIIIKYFFVDNVAPFVSDIDGQNYSVRKVGSDNVKQTAANYLAILNEKINKIVNYMNEHNLPDLDTAKRLFNRWSKCNLKETSSNEKSAAYTLNKNVEIRICIRDGLGNFEDINTSMFVILHELAHVMSVGYGHEEEFKNNFSYITHLASKLGIYKPEDFGHFPKTYCGISINTTPCDNGSCEYGG
jgi:hypothetical protein